MQILLNQEEYLALRPSRLRERLIDDIRAHLNPEDFRGNDIILDQIRESITRFDREMGRQHDHYDLLWPAPQA